MIARVAAAVASPTLPIGIRAGAPARCLMTQALAHHGDATLAHPGSDGTAKRG